MSKTRSDNTRTSLDESDQVCSGERIKAMLQEEMEKGFSHITHIELNKRVKQTRTNNSCMEIHLSQIYGSGIEEDHPEYGNAVKMMARILKKLLYSGIPVTLCEWNGNPSECEAVMPVKEMFQDDIERIIAETYDDILKEAGAENYAGTLEIHEFEFKGHMMDKKDSRDLINFVYLLPNHSLGRSHVSREMFSACLISDIHVNEGKLEIVMDGFNQYESSVEELVVHIRTLAYLYQFEYQMEEKVDE